MNSEDDVQPIAEGLGKALTEQNIRVVPCPKGQVIGQESNVRVFDVQHIKADTTEHSQDENPPAWLRACASGEILLLGQEAVVFFRVGKQGLVLVQRNAWSAGRHELEWVDQALLAPVHRRASGDEGNAPSEGRAARDPAATGDGGKTLPERSRRTS